MNRWAALALVTLLVVLAGSSTLLRQHGSTPVADGAEGLPVPDYFIDNLTAVTMDPEGRPREQLTATHLIRLRDQPVVDVTTPHLVLYRPDEPPWEVTAARARVFEQLHQVELIENVTLAQAGEHPLQLVTEQMLIDTARRTAATDAPLTVTEPNSRVEAVGMRAYLDAERVELLHAVQSRYVPTR